VIVVEDDPDLAEVVRASLDDEFFDVTVARDGETALACIEAEVFDVALVDLMLPGLDGYEVCARLHSSQPGVALLIVTALGTSEEILRGLAAGADDYLVKPFGLSELVARIRAILRRRGSARSRDSEPSDATQPVDFLEVAGIRLEVGSDRAWYASIDLDLRARQHDLLAVFMARPGLVLTRRTIRGALSTPGNPVSDTTVDYHLSQLRKKLQAAGGHRLIETVFGMGWRLRVPDGF
jgi:DNA-binding response OmpR family regulator